MKQKTAQCVMPEHKDSFSVSYDIRDILTYWGNWARQGVNENSTSSMLYGQTPQPIKPCCSDEDAELIGEMLSKFRRSKNEKIREEYEVLSLYYYGASKMVEHEVFIEPEKSRLESFTIICRQTLEQISRILGRNISEVNKIKLRGETRVETALSMLTMLTGQELDLLKNFKYCT